MSVDTHDWYRSWVAEHKRAEKAEQQNAKLREILDAIEHRWDACDITFQQSCPACRWDEMKKELGNE